MDALGTPTPAFLVPASLAKKLANLHFVVGVLECAPIAEVSMTPLIVQRPSFAFGVPVSKTVPHPVTQDITFLVQTVLTLAQEHPVTPIVQHATLQHNAILVPQDITFQVLYASTPVQQERPSPIVHHVVLQLNALLVRLDITFRA